MTDQETRGFAGHDPDRQGQLGDVVLGYESIDGVIGGQPSMGAFITVPSPKLGQ